MVNETKSLDRKVRVSWSLSAVVKRNILSMLEKEPGLLTGGQKE
jgi:hypothetical protein